MHRLIRHPAVVFVAFWLGLWMLLKLDIAFTFNGLFLPVVLAMSVFAVFKMIRQRNFGPYGQISLMSAGWRRWILDERNEQEPGR